MVGPVPTKKTVPVSMRMCIHVCICNCHGYVLQQNSSLYTAPSHSEVRARSSLVSLTTPETKQRQRQMEQERGERQRQRERETQGETEREGTRERSRDRDRQRQTDGGRNRGRERTFMSERLWRLRAV